MPVAATYWLPSLNPIGPASFVPAAIVVGLIVFCSSWMPARLRRIALYAATPILLTSAILSPGSFLIGERFLGFEEFLGYFLLIGFGFGFGLRLFRVMTRTGPVMGSIAVFLFGSLITVDVAAKAQGAWTLYYGATEIVSSLAVALLLFWALFGVLVWQLNRNWRMTFRAMHGLCLQCGYDLRGSGDSPSCPECGALRLASRRQSVRVSKPD